MTFITKANSSFELPLEIAAQCGLVMAIVGETVREKSVDSDTDTDDDSDDDDDDDDDTVEVSVRSISDEVMSICIAFMQHHHEHPWNTTYVRPITTDDLHVLVKDTFDQVGQSALARRRVSTSGTSAE